MPIHKPLASLIAVAPLLVGCASVAVTADLIEQRTAFALGMERGNFTVSNRQDDGLRTQDAATTETGQRHNCYVEGSVGITGRVVSDAICSKPGEAPKNPLLQR